MNFTFRFVSPCESLFLPHLGLKFVTYIHSLLLLVLLVNARVISSQPFMWEADQRVSYRSQSLSPASALPEHCKLILASDA